MIRTRRGELRLNVIDDEQRGESIPETLLAWGMHQEP